MKASLGIAIVLSTLPFAALAQGPNAEAGRAKASTLCAACHGANGVSVSDTIPNLAGQRAVYLESQLKALKDGTRKNPIMNAIAAQLRPADITNIAAYYGSLAGAASGARSDMLPNVARTHVSFPEGYKDSFRKYHAINFPVTKQVRYYFANKPALEAARAGKPLPDGSMLLAEVHSAKLDADKNPIMGADGFYEPDKLLFYTAMQRDAGWGRDIPEELRNEEWNYAIFTTARQHRGNVNQAECLACHKPLDNVSYTFTLKELGAAK